MISNARLAFAGISDVPVRAAAAEDLLVGERPSTELFDEAARRATSDVEPPADLHGSSDYRKRSRPLWCVAACEQLRTTPARGSD